MPIRPQSNLKSRWAALFAKVGHWLLGKSSSDYLKQFTGGDLYIDEAIAANPNSIPAEVKKHV